MQLESVNMGVLFYHTEYPHNTPRRVSVSETTGEMIKSSAVGGIRFVLVSAWRRLDHSVDHSVVLLLSVITDQPLRLVVLSTDHCVLSR